ncbi:MAG TPA: bifunctional UDP-N-acetylglucosamine diphosphorylase/glucosamine-1-phosphate N-acetyltransferase GlmU [Micromonosporaceae bacterium]|nr:bifunctional UDP-N-acetylglucosamine diphosphorylase/glucosamine-1-phosphate N-acetyltransferase GlmU [Micromonosporaceae bacterium]
MSDDRARTVIVLAAGEGKRMKSALPKVMHPILGRTLLGHVLAAAEPLRAEHTLVVVGNGAGQVRTHLAEIAPSATPVLQKDQRGTGHAVRTALAAAPEGGPGTVLVLSGDVPLLRTETLVGLVNAHEAAGAAASVLTAVVADPNGLGRIIRDGTGELAAIVEERDTSPAQREISEINSGIYAFSAAALADGLGKLTTHNDQGEEYLTDVIELLVGAGHRVRAHAVGDPTEAAGCNDRAQLAALRALLRDRVNRGWMCAGVTIVDPATTWIDVTATLDLDVVVEPNTHLRGVTDIGTGATVGPDTTLIDVVVGEGASVVRTHGVGARIGPYATIGPYTYLRPGTQLADQVKVGTFVEVKNSQVGTGTKIPHLSYVGDATIGEHSNIGAANVVVNYDGVAKHRTVIGSYVRTGSDTMLVAPVEIGDGAYTGAGTVVRRNVPPGALAVSGGPQRIFEGWVDSHRRGTDAAEAAARARQAANPDDETPAGGT